MRPCVAIFFFGLEKNGPLSMGLALNMSDQGGVMKDAKAVYAAMHREKVNGMSLVKAVGDGDPKQVGDMSVSILNSFGLLGKGTRVLDLGCGCGRLSMSLVDVLGPKTRYVGTDIIPEMPIFCRKEITNRWPNFEFYWVKEKNPCYDSWIKPGPQAQEHLLEDTASLNGQFDLVIASSVFTHLSEKEARVMLKRVRAWLAPGGAALLSFFILNRWSRKRIKEGQADLFLGMKAEKARELNFQSNGAVAFDASFLEEMVLDAGFPGIQAISHGTWTHAPGKHLQDYAVLKRDLPLPEGFDSGRYLALHPDVAKAGVDAGLHWQLHGKREGRQWK
jgi:2-polyprenyl-3-methyl-5-hydroxy-6-metoxy-1,4-benzoquinol methylase